jgi:methyl-accepting chemotaxis protein
VVADEVRKLSQTSNQFNGQIQDLVERAKRTIGETLENVKREAAKDRGPVRQGKQRVDQMTTHLAQQEQAMGQGLQQVNDLSARIEQHTGVAIRGLQFEDIVRQITEQAGSKIVRTLSMISDLTEQLATVDSPDLSPDDRRQRLSELATRVRDLTHDLNHEVTRHKVEQVSMDAGGVELF